MLIDFKKIGTILCLGLTNFSLLMAAPHSGPLENGPVVVGNGGDSVRCKTSSENNFRGLYSFDYLMTFQTSNANADIVPVANWSESADRIESLLRKNFPDLAFGFADFSGLIGNQNDLTKARIWQEAGFGLVDISDERIIRKIPANCYEEFQEDRITIVQTIVRIGRSDGIQYEFDPGIVREFDQFAPLQYSFLLVHEWLWDFVSDPVVIRNINRFLHSKSASDQTPSQFRESLLRLGLDLRPQEFRAVCDRPAWMRHFLETTLGKSCDQLTASSGLLAYVGVFNIDGEALSSIDPRDLSGLEKVNQFTINNAGLQHIFSTQFELWLELSGLDLSHNKLRELPISAFAETIEGFPKLHKIILNDNLFTEIPDSVWTFGEGIDMEWNLSQNSITQFPAVLPKLRSRRAGKLTLNLSSNGITELPSDLCDQVHGFFSLSSTLTLDLRNNPLSQTARRVLLDCGGTMNAKFDLRP